MAHISGMYLHIWSYEGNDDCEWEIYPYQSGYGSLVCELSEVISGKGYWIEIIEDTNLIVSGLTSQKTITLKKGWNLIGFNSAQSLLIEDALSSIIGKYISVWSFDDGHWNVYDPANPQFSDLQTMMPYHGYWINALDATDWTLP